MTKNRLSFVLLFGLFIFSLFWTSCSSSKKAIRTPIKEEGSEYLITQMMKNQNHFETFKGKALASITSNGKTNDLKINIRIRKDSAIWVSISAGVGLEAARVMLTKDSVMFLNRIDKTFFAGNYQFINRMINAQVDFDIVQALLTGNDFKWYDYQELKASIDNQSYQLESAHRRKLKKYSKLNEEMNVIYQSIWLNPFTFKIERIKIKEIKNNNKKIDAFYSNFKSINNQVLPMQYDITISANEDVVIDATLIKAELDDDLSFPFNIPSKYEEIK